MGLKQKHANNMEYKTTNKKHITKSIRLQGCDFSYDSGNCSEGLRLVKQMRVTKSLVVENEGSLPLSLITVE
jgi:hypothetical protein